ncbi:MAG TPA: hypothetical protein VM529_05900, partial [Gemmata sp.]|nr:hypothetical protein [Gemmata sp.]
MVPAFPLDGHEELVRLRLERRDRLLHRGEVVEVVLRPQADGQAGNLRVAQPGLRLGQVQHV